MAISVDLFKNQIVNEYFSTLKKLFEKKGVRYFNLNKDLFVVKYLR